MAQQYLLPCACGKQLPVGVAQAGGSVTCACGSQRMVPTLGALRQLASTTPEKAVQEPPADWTAARGGMFAGGVLALLLGAIIGAYGNYEASKIDITDHSLKLQETAFAEFDKLQADQVLDLWKDIRHIDLSNTRKASHIQAQADYRSYRKLLYTGVGIALLGLFSFAGSLMGGKSNA